jgi:hypothetical protein
MKRRAFRPILESESHPGEAVNTVFKTIFPFDSESTMSEDVQNNIKYIFDNKHSIPRDRRRAVTFWRSRAEALRKASLHIIKQQPESVRKILYHGDKIGEFYHVLLFEEMINAAKHGDKTIAHQIAKGMNIVGPVEKSNVWPTEEVPAISTVQAYIQGAWAYRQKIEKETQQHKHHNYEINKDVYDSTEGERDLGFCEGPFTESEVSTYFNTDEWASIRRFGIEQKDKIRPIDDACANGANMTSSRSEKLITSSIDQIVSLIREWLSLDRNIKLGSFAVDEYKAYRQIPLSPEQRRISVIAVSILTQVF